MVGCRQLAGLAAVAAGSLVVVAYRLVAAAVVVEVAGRQAWVGALADRSPLAACSSRSLGMWSNSLGPPGKLASVAGIPGIARSWPMAVQARTKWRLA